MTIRKRQIYEKTYCNHVVSGRFNVNRDNSNVGKDEGINILGRFGSVWLGTYYLMENRSCIRHIRVKVSVSLGTTYSSIHYFVIIITSILLSTLPQRYRIERIFL